MASILFLGVVKLHNDVQIVSLHPSLADSRLYRSLEPHQHKKKETTLTSYLGHTDKFAYRCVPSFFPSIFLDMSIKKNKRDNDLVYLRSHAIESSG